MYYFKLHPSAGQPLKRIIQCLDIQRCTAQKYFVEAKGGVHPSSIDNACETHVLPSNEGVKDVITHPEGRKIRGGKEEAVRDCA